ncbi:MAG TPA: DUF2442 domain-containing protein [Candidatus Sulfotelmatobacter sp.]|nr:DUF2442 domain-containing protein [Candidatus Sulfotelmatobacter sp.]
MSKQVSHPIRTTEAQLEAALAKARDYDAVRPRALDVSYRDADDMVIMRLATGIEMAFPRQLLQGLENATPEQLRDVSIDDFGSSLHWNQLDVDHYVPGLIEGILGTRAWMSRIGKRGGSARSDVKAAAARENGAKGGRPSQPGLDARNRDTGGHIHHKRGDTLVRTLRDTYGDSFAPGVRGDMRLDTLLKRENAKSLDDLLKRRRK